MIRPASPSLRSWLARSGTVAQYGRLGVFAAVWEDTPLSIDAAAEPDGDVLKWVLYGKTAVWPSLGVTVAA